MVRTKKTGSPARRSKPPPVHRSASPWPEDAGTSADVSTPSISKKSAAKPKNVATPRSSAKRTRVEEKVAMSARAASTLDPDETEDEIFPAQGESVAKRQMVTTLIPRKATVTVDSITEVSASPASNPAQLQTPPSLGVLPRKKASAKAKSTPRSSKLKANPKPRYSRKSAKFARETPEYELDGTQKTRSPPKVIHEWSKKRLSNMDFEIENEHARMVADADPKPNHNQMRYLPSTDSEGEDDQVGEDDNSENNGEVEDEYDDEDSDDQDEKPMTRYQQYIRKQPRFQANDEDEIALANPAPQAAASADPAPIPVPLRLDNPDLSDSDMSDGFEPIYVYKPKSGFKGPYEQFPASNHPDFLPPRGRVPTPFVVPMHFSVLPSLGSATTHKSTLERLSGQPRKPYKPGNFEVRMAFSSTSGSTSTTPGINRLARPKGELESWAKRAVWDNPAKNVADAAALAALKKLQDCSLCDHCNGKCGICGGDMVKEVRKRKVVRADDDDDDDGEEKKPIEKKQKRMAVERLTNAPKRRYVWKNPMKNRAALIRQGRGQPKKKSKKQLEREAAAAAEEGEGSGGVESLGGEGGENGEGGESEADAVDFED